MVQSRMHLETFILCRETFYESFVGTFRKLSYIHCLNNFTHVFINEGPRSTKAPESDLQNKLCLQFYFRFLMVYSGNMNTQSSNLHFWKCLLN